VRTAGRIGPADVLDVGAGSRREHELVGDDRGRVAGIGKEGGVLRIDALDLPLRIRHPATREVVMVLLAPKQPSVIIEVLGGMYFPNAANRAR
jgi:hypothetical protein